MIEMLASFLSTALLLLSVLIVPSASIARGKHRGASVPASIEFIRLAFLLALLVGYLELNGLSLESVGLGRESSLTFAVSVALSIAAIVLFECVALVALMANPRANGKATEALAPQVPQDRFEAVRFIAYLGLAVMWEELLFRGVANHIGMSLGVPPMITIAVSSIIFGMQHIRRGWGQVIYSGCFGAFFFGLYLMWDSLYPVIAAHIAGNLVVVFYSYPRMVECRHRDQQARGSSALPY